jgi:TPR repeat protein
MLRFFINKTRKNSYSTFYESGLKYLDNKQYKEALDTFSKSTKPESFKKIAELYLSGILDGEPNHVNAIKYFKIASDMGDVESLIEIGFFFHFLLKKGNLYKNGGNGLKKNKFNQIQGVKINHIKSMDYYKKAAEKSSIARIQLGLIYLKGNSVIQKNETMALKYFKDASVLGNHDGFYHLGTIYLDKGDFSNAERNFLIGAKFGNGKCLFSLGLNLID